MTKLIKTIIVGGGQGGLATSYFLKKAGHKHYIFEKAQLPAQVWRNRWDSFTLITPNWMLQLPGAEYDGDNPDGFMKRTDVVNYFESYFNQFDLPVRYGIRVNTVELLNSHFFIQTDQGEFLAENVVIATGLYQKPKIPHFHRKISQNIHQIHSSEYRNPELLPPGSVLVVGSSQSGSQIAEEIYQSGRKVYLSVSSAGRMPRRYRGKDVTRWMDKMGYFTRLVDELQSPQDKYASSAHGTGKDGGHTINLHQFARDGVTLVGRVKDASGYQISFASDLKENLMKADQFEAYFIREVDAYIATHKLDIPEESLPQMTDGYHLNELEDINLRDQNINSIIWATGYAFDFSWVKLPVFDKDGYPIQKRGVSHISGLYFIGLPFLHTGISGVIAGVGADAEHISSVILNHSYKIKSEFVNDG